MNYLKNKKQDNLVQFLPEPEKWLPITDQVVPGIKPYYMISTYGNIYSSFSNKTICTANDGDDYEIVNLQTFNGVVTKRVHRLLMMTFCYFPGCEQYEVDHKDGYHYHNWIWNLEWVTPKENVNRSIQLGLHAIAGDMYNSIFTNEEVHYICRQLELGKSISELVVEMTEKIYPRQYKDIRGLLLHIRNGYAWKSISSLYNIPESDFETFNHDEIIKICECLEKRMNYKEILTYLGYDINGMSNKQLNTYNKVISNIRSGRTYTDISKNYNISSGHYQILSNEQIEEVCKILGDNYNTPLKDVLSMIGYDVENMEPNKLRNMKSAISIIKNKRSFTDISDKYFSKPV